jgi:nitrite reductase (NO-forming) / hydroxylamine reductase
VDPELAAQGERLFKGAASCLGCHALGRRMAGPDLIGVVTRRGADWVRKFIADPAEVIATDPQAEAMWNEWKYTMQTPRLRPSQIDAIVHYLQRETEKKWGQGTVRD